MKSPINLKAWLVRMLVNASERWQRTAEWDTVVSTGQDPPQKLLEGEPGGGAGSGPAEPA